jgi:hypothetical protein
MKNPEPSRLRSGTSCGFVGTGLCGIGFNPSAAASPPVSTAMTPGPPIACATFIFIIFAWACGETHEIRMELARQAEVTCVLSGVGDQSCVLAARYRFSDAMRGMALAGCQKRHQVLSSKWLLLDDL